MVLTVCGCHCRSAASFSATSLAATGSWSQTTFITSHSASEIPGALAISQPFRLQVWLEYDYECGCLSSKKGEARNPKHEARNKLHIQKGETANGRDRRLANTAACMR